MRVLVVAATDGELTAFRDPTPAHGYTLDVLVTGIGMVATAAHVAHTLARTPYDLALNLGVCGTFDRRLALGTVVHVTSDCLPELGVQDGPTFIPAHVAGLMAADVAPYTGGRLINQAPPPSAILAGLPPVTGITVNTVHGEEEAIAAVVARVAPQVESMEGAAFMYACLMAGVPYAQIRAVSNYVERRNRAAWRLETAIEALGRTASALLVELGGR
jgi:futalosine hydrolase